MNEFQVAIGESTCASKLYAAPIGRLTTLTTLLLRNAKYSKKKKFSSLYLNYINQ
jgi:hypothetical protein